MTHDEAVSVLETIKELYPSFSLSKKKAQVLIPPLKQMDYDGVMARLSEFVMHHKYAPTISEIAVYPKKENDHLEQRQKWRQAADKVSPDIKKRFHDALRKLVIDKGDTT